MRRNKTNSTKKKGATLATVVFFLIVLLAFVAFAVDLGYLVNSKAELQRSADAAAMAACWEYADQLSIGANHSSASVAAVTSASNAVNDNLICGSSPTLSTTDLTLGYVADFSNRTAPMDVSTPEIYNAVKVTVRRTSTVNGQVPFFFARIFGVDGIDTQANATAAIVRDIRGFQTPSDGSNLGMMPFALRETAWNDLMAGNGTDDWTWNKTDMTVVPGSDGVLELDLYPHNTGSSGNSGTVDIGSDNNSTSDVARQIVDGVSPSDLSHHGGKLELDDNGELELNGDTGISAGIKDELASIVGETRTIPIYRRVQGPGNNAQFTIVAWANVRIMDVKLTGSKKSKHVIIQPAPVVAKGVIPSSGGSGTSDYVYSPVVLIR